MFSGLDIAILVIIVVSLLVGLLRGFIREVFSLIAWILAFWVAFTYAQTISPWFAPYVDHTALQIAAAFCLLFVATLLAASLVSFILYRLLSVTGITGFDRGLGAIFGILRGILIVGSLLLAARLTPLPEQPWWRDSSLVSHFEPVVEILKDVLPIEITRDMV